MLFTLETNRLLTVLLAILSGWYAHDRVYGSSRGEYNLIGSLPYIVLIHVR